MRAPPTAPTIIPTRAPVERLGFDVCATDVADEDTVSVGAGEVVDADTVTYPVL